MLRSRKAQRSCFWTIAGGPPLSSTDLAALTLANGCAIAWLSLAQGATSGRLPLPLPLGCTLLLPLLAFFAGQPLRKGESTTATNPKPT